MATTSVVLCSYTMERLTRLQRALESLSHQSRAPDEIIVVSDYCDEVFDAVFDLEVGKVFRNLDQQGLSGARNTGLRAASGEFVAFLDDDAVPEQMWLEKLIAPLEEAPGAIATGGWVEPDGNVPSWYPREFYWVFGCSWAGLEQRQTLRNPIGAAMAWRRDVLTSVGGFSSEVGRSRTAALRSCEDTLTAITASASGGSVIHAVDAIAHHYVGPERLTYGYLVRRCWNEGISKRLVRQLSGRPLEEEAAHSLRIATTIVSNLTKPSQWRSAVVCLIGWSCCLAGYLFGALRWAARSTRAAAT